jgi:hypothetical protein
MKYTWHGRGSPDTLTDRDFKLAAGRLGCDVAAIKAIWEVEAVGRHFLADRSVVRRFEPHHFPRSGWSDIGFSVREGEAPWRASLRLSDESMFRRAAGLDADAAMRASSWGAPQIMGFNHADAGFASARDMVAHMAVSAAHQLGAFVQLVETWGIAGAIRAHDWTSFARHYNGSGQVEHYARLMEAAYRRHSGNRSSVVLRVGARGAAVNTLQRALALDVDGVFGPQTLAAVREFQRSMGLEVDGVVGHKTWGALSRLDDAPEPPAQPDVVDARTNLAGHVASGVAAVTGVAAAGAEIRALVPEQVWTFALTSAVVLGFAAAAAYIIRWARR